MLSFDIKTFITRFHLTVVKYEDDGPQMSSHLYVYHTPTEQDLYEDNAILQSIIDYLESLGLRIPEETICFSESGAQDDEYMHFDVSSNFVPDFLNFIATHQGLPQTFTSEVTEEDD